MKRSLKFRLHEWAAERFSFVQYPSIRPANDASRIPGPVRFRHAMPFWRRMDIVLISLAGVAIGGTVLFFLCLVIWSVVFG